MTRRAYIFVPGILNYPGRPTAWTDRAVTWVHTNTDSVAEKYEYMAFPLSRRIKALQRANGLAELMDHYDSYKYELIIAAHSNGCEVTRLALGIAKRHVNRLILMAPAIPAIRHGLLDQLGLGRIVRLSLLIATEDKFLASRFLGGRPVSQIKAVFGVAARAGVLFVPGGHSTFFTQANFEQSMQYITGETP